jgi:archaellum component FlaC
MTQDASILYKNIVDFGTGIGGYEHNYSISNYESYSVIHAEFKVPPEKLSIFVNFIGESGDVINSSMNSEDITENYYDATIRLDTEIKSLERYYDLLSKAVGSDEIVKIQRIIDGITEEIEALEGRLKVWNSQVSMATVSLYIRQNNDPIQIRKEINWNTLSFDDMGYLIKRGFFSITNTFISILQWLIVIIIGYSPLWIIIAICALLFVIWKKKKNAKKVSVSPRKDE